MHTFIIPKHTSWNVSARRSNTYAENIKFISGKTSSFRSARSSCYIRQNLSMKMRKKESGGIFSRFIVGLYTIFLLRTQVYLNTERCILMWMRLQVILLPWYIRIRQVTVILVRKINEKGNSFREIPDLYCWDYVIVFYKSFSGK